MTVTQADRPRTAALIRTAGELFEVHGDLLLKVTADWSAGAKSANLDPTSRGNRSEDCGPTPCPHCPHPVPSDPTGEAAIAAARSDYGDRVRAALDRMVEDAQFLKDAFHVIAPIVPPSTMNEKDTMWCSHHLRIGLAEVRHRGTLCRTCDDFLKLWKVHPPVSLLRIRHERGPGSWNEKAVKEALEADGVILSTVGGVTKAVRQARSGKPNQNERKKAKAS